MTLHAHLPQDRLRAIANNTTLPDRTSGSALFADISGFTALTTSLREKFGSRQGAEELTRQLREVYTALIAEIERFDGSVIGFAGDSMLCWFDNSVDGDLGTEIRAVGAAFAMQNAIGEFPGLALKVSIASGNARRFAVGDEAIQRIDALAGAAVARTAAGELLANKGDVLVDDVTANVLGSAVGIKEWRIAEGGGRFAVVTEWTGEWGSVPDESQLPSPDPQTLKSWIHHAVYERETSGQGTFLTEFRPCVALFIRFTGIDYDSDSAEIELDTFIREVQRVAFRYEGTLLDITIGDKGSYAYVNFGALNTHEDDSRRAVKTALELRNNTELQLQMGITQGLMRVGAYGGETRKVFGALGDDVNLAARLMTTAREHEILVSSHVHKAVKDHFTFEPRPPLSMKGKSEPLPVFAVTGENQRRAVRLQEPNYSLPMVGRQEELKLIEEKLELAMQGRSQVIGIIAEAGLGKSRLVAEVIRSARKKGFVGFGGACQSDSIHTPYLAWKSIWGAFFEVDPDSSLKKQMRNIEGEIEDRAPERMDAMPLLNAVLDLNIPENKFTQNLEPKIRQSALHALLEDCLKSASRRGAASYSQGNSAPNATTRRGAVPAPNTPAPNEHPDINDKEEPTSPLLIVIEDLHWIDALSHDLLEQLVKALANYAVCFVLAYRPPQLERLQAPRIESLEQFTRIELRELTTAEAENAVRAKLTQLYPARGGSLPEGLMEVLMTRAQGNPFYLEELLNYVRDRGLDPSDIENIELPDSLHTLILSRIDQLSEGEKTTLRAASIVGRLFRAKWLTGYYPELGSLPQVKAALDELDKLEITPLESEPELIYLFKHIVTHEVTYESLPFATRARLHEQLAVYLESIVGMTRESPLLETIAFHYARSENQEKQVEYLRKAGEVAQRNFANDAALEYYNTLLPLITDTNEKVQIHLKRGEVLELVGRYDEAEADYLAALDSEKTDRALKASAQFALGELNRLRGNYKDALDWLAQAKEEYVALGESARVSKALVETGMILIRKGELMQAGEKLNEGLALAKEVNYKRGMAAALNTLGILTWQLGDYTKARRWYEESLILERELGHKKGIAMVLNNLGIMASEQGDHHVAQGILEECQILCREMGEKYGICVSLGNLGVVMVLKEDYRGAQALFEECLSLRREIGDKLGIGTDLSNLGGVALAQHDHEAARRLYGESLAMCREIQDKTQTAYALLGLGLAWLSENRSEAREYILESLRLRQELGVKHQLTSSLIGVVALELNAGNASYAAHMLGAIDAALKGIGAVVESDVLYIYKQTMDAVLERLGESAFQSAFEVGLEWSLEETVKKVLAG